MVVKISHQKIRRTSGGLKSITLLTQDVVWTSFERYGRQMDVETTLKYVKIPHSKIRRTSVGL